MYIGLDNHREQLKHDVESIQVDFYIIFENLLQFPKFEHPVVTVIIVNVNLWTSFARKVIMTNSYVFTKKAPVTS